MIHLTCRWWTHIHNWMLNLFSSWGSCVMLQIASKLYKTTPISRTIIHWADFFKYIHCITGWCLKHIVNNGLNHLTKHFFEANDHIGNTLLKAVEQNEILTRILRALEWSPGHHERTVLYHGCTLNDEKKVWQLNTTTSMHCVQEVLFLWKSS